MSAETLAEKLGLAPHSSPLLAKARRLGLVSARELESLAVTRGCWHYRHPDLTPVPGVSESMFSDAELAIALLSPCWPYSPHSLRVGAAMLGASGNDPKSVARLAMAERCVPLVGYIARAGHQYEPDNDFWPRLLASLPDEPEPADGVMPHPTRFVSMTGLTRAGHQRITVWIRPRANLALAHG